MHQTRNNIKSANKQDPKNLEEPLMTPLEEHTNTVFTNIINHKRQITTDLTGKLPVTSNKVNEYLFVLYKYNINGILVHPMKSISDRELVPVFKDLHEHLLTRGFNTAYIIL